MISAFDSDKSTTAQSYDEEYGEDAYLELQSCLEEWKDAHQELKYANEEAYANLNGWGEGDEYYDLIDAMDEAKSTLENPGDNTPYCD